MEKSRRARLAAAAALLPMLGLTAACAGSSPSHDWSALAADAGTASVRVSPASAGAGTARTVDPAKPLVITAEDGETLSDVTAVDGHSRVLGGVLDADGTAWRSTDGLAAGETYTVKVATVTRDGSPAARTLRFRTGAATHVLKTEVEPANGATVGVGQPIAVALAKAVTTPAGRRAVESHLAVTSTPATTGSWYWVDDKTLHYRPKAFWPAHSKVVLHQGLGGVKIEGDTYGEPDRTVAFSVGDALVATADADSHYMTVRRDGKAIRSIPITMGKPGFSTRNGVKVVLGKEAYVRMRSSTVGISAGSSESYDLPVHWATRLTWSGEYVHAAPWSVGSQGVTNASHGCVGMSTGNAEWFFSQVRPGDVVKVVNSAGHEMEHFGNGFGDWNIAWPAWRKGSALGAAGAASDAAAKQDDRTAGLQPVTYLRPRT